MGWSKNQIINQMNKDVIITIEEKNDKKNKLIQSSYWFNPVSFVQNKWSSYTFTDYYSYKDYRMNIQGLIDKKIELITFECWDKRRVNKSIYNQYLTELNILINL